MQNLREFFGTRRNLISVFVLAFIALTLPLGLYLVKQQQTLRSNAAGELIQLAEGNCILTTNGVKTAICNTIPLKLTNPFGLSSAQPSSTVSATPRASASSGGFVSPSPSQAASAANCATSASTGEQLLAAVNCYKKAAGTNRRITLSAGTFEVNEKIPVPSNITIIGAGMNATIIKKAAGTFPDDALMANDSSAGQENIVLRDFTLQGDGVRTGNSCCYGLKLQNITNAFVVNVAANNWGIDGIFVGMRPNKPGAKNVRITGCQVNNNGRNGISMVDVTDSVIDHCQISGNSTNELVSAIDLEPDNGNTVSNVHIFENSINNNRNNGIQLLENPHDPGGAVFNNYVCNNTYGGNGGTDFDDRGAGTKTSGCTAGSLTVPVSLNITESKPVAGHTLIEKIINFLPHFTVYGDNDDNTGCNNGPCDQPAPSPSVAASVQVTPSAAATPSTASSPSAAASASLLPSPSPASSATASASTAPTGNSYRLAETQAGLAQAQWVAFAGSTIVANFTASSTPGAKQVWVEFKGPSAQTITDHISYTMLAPVPVLSNINCNLDIINKNVKITVTGTNLGAEKGTLTANSGAVEVSSWSDTAITGLIKGSGETGQKYTIGFKRADNMTAPSPVCEVNVSSLSVGAKVFCRENSATDVSSVKVAFFSPDAPAKKIEETAVIDKDGILQGLKTKLSPGTPYVISLKAPYSVRRNAGFTGMEGTTIINGPGGKPFILPIGDISPAAGDGQINALDRAELVKQWRILDSSGSATLTGDFNRDKKVNSVDWACMKYDFNAKDDAPDSLGSSSSGSPGNGQFQQGQNSVIFTTP